MKRLSLPVALLAITLAGCGGNDSATTSASTSAGPATVTTSTSTSTSIGSSSAPAGVTSSTQSSSAARTQVELLDPRATSGEVAAGYTVENHATDDLWCAQSGITGPAIYARGRNVFTCGPTAAGLQACWQLDAGHIGCIRGEEPRKVIRLPWSGAPVRTAAVAHATPIRAILADGTVCTPKSHDQEQHYQNRQGWYVCGDMTLLAKDPSSGTGTEIDMSTPLWTADAAVGTAKPHKVTITKAYFAQGD